MDKVSKMLQYAKRKHAEKHRDDELSFLAELPTETLRKIASGNITDAELWEVIQNGCTVKDENSNRSTKDPFKGG